MTADLSALGETLRRHDHDRYATAMFADPARRDDLWLLYGFNLELSQIRSQVREPLAGMIRLQWWRDVINGARREEALRHPVAGPLVHLIEDRQLPLTDFNRLLDARENDLEPIPFANRDQWTAYGRDSAGALARLACRTLGEDAAAAEALGTVWALTGLLRSLPFHLAQGWMTLPQECLAAEGLDGETVLAAKAGKDALARVVRALVTEVRQLDQQARRLSYGRAAVPALLPAVLARSYLRRMENLGGDVFDSRSYRPQPRPVRLALAALLGRL